MSHPDGFPSKPAEAPPTDGETERLLERLRASEAQARHQAALLAAVLDSAPDIIFRIDQQGVIRFANKFPPPLSVTGVVGRAWESLSPEDERPAMRRAVETVFATGEGAGLEWRMERPDGGVTWMSTRIAPIREGRERVGAVVVCRDVTETKEAEAQLLIADRMASVGTLAAGVAHEINNPLSALLANLDVIREDVESIGEQRPLPPDLSPALLETQNAAERIKAIVRDLKLFSQVDGDRRASVNLHDVLDSTLRMAGNEIRHRARLVRDYAEIPPVLGSQARLGQVFLNLLLNAAQAIPAGHYDDNEIRVSTSVEPDGEVLVRIVDTGVGIPPEIQQRLFTPFFTTKEVGNGTGLGLSVCQRIVKSLNGAISFSSRKGGTEFRVTLPAAPPARRDPGQPAGAPSTSKSKPRYSVLFIDDDAMVAHAARRVMSEHAITIASSAHDALGLLAQGDRFDVIFCDLMMPQVTGMELFAELEKIAPEQARRVVFMTGGAYTPGATAFLESVANRRVDKPFDLVVLQAMLDEVSQSEWEAGRPGEGSVDGNRT
jgi:PAS domain S-box-containing protein